MNNSIMLKIDKDVFEKVKMVSYELSITISEVLRQVLKLYKIENRDIANKDLSEQSNQIIVKVRSTEEICKEEYDMYAENICTEDIIKILKDVYNI